MSSPETTAEWIVARMDEVLARYPEDEVQRALPALIMQMCGELGFENLEPDFQQIAARIAVRIGLVEGQSPAEMEALTTRYVRELDPNPKLFEEVGAIFRQHEAALMEHSADAYRRRFDQQPDRSAPDREAVRPEGSVAAESFARTMTGRIKS